MERQGVDWYILPAYYLTVVAIGLLSFVFNLRRFAWSRFLPFLALAAIWAILISTSPFFALVFAAVVAPNGQEWYHDRFGTEGRTGRGWTIVVDRGTAGDADRAFRHGRPRHHRVGRSTAGDAVWLGLRPRHLPHRGGRVPRGPRRDQGERPEHVAGAGRRADLEGRAQAKDVTSTAALGCFRASSWSNGTTPASALRDDDVAAWKPLLDKYKITVVVIETDQLARDLPAVDAEPELGAVSRRRPHRDVRPRRCAGVGPGVLQGQPA